MQEHRFLIPMILFIVLLALAAFQDDVALAHTTLISQHCSVAQTHYLNPDLMYIYIKSDNPIIEEDDEMYHLCCHLLFYKCQGRIGSSGVCKIPAMRRMAPPNMATILKIPTVQDPSPDMEDRVIHLQIIEVEHDLSLLEHYITTKRMERELDKMDEHMKLIKWEQDEQALDSLPPSSKRAIGRASDNKNSAWLTVMPLARHHFDLSANEFRDGLALRYMRPVFLPASCDGCGDAFDIDHALNCKIGGLILGRHNEIRDAIGDLAAQAWGHSNVWKEPIILEANTSTGKPGLQADLAVRGVWEPQGDALFDIRVVNTDAPSYRSCPVVAVLKSAALEKKNKYALACEDRHSSFTPIVLSVDGVLEQEAAGFTRRIAERLAAKWEKSYGETMGWVRARLSFAILRATSMCLRGTRVRWRCLGFEDGAGIRISMN